MRLSICITRCAILAATIGLAVGCDSASAPPIPPSAPTSADPAEDPSIENAPSTNVAQLGEPSLTGGIPGEGELTVEQIHDWLAAPENHDTLEVILPVGLSLGQGQIVIPGDNPLTRAKIELGRQLYFDRRLSSDSTVSCADCHHPDEGYAKHTQFGVGIDGQQGNRNSPVSYNRILSSAQFWDGRAASLEEQAVGPIANPIEMGNTHEQAVETVNSLEGYRIQFEAIFPDAIVTIENIGKAIASFERAIVTGPSAYDVYEPLRVFQQTYAQDIKDLEALKEDDLELHQQYQSLVEAAKANPMSDSAKRGRDLAFSEKGSCTACHAGANFTDEKHHNLGVGMAVEKPDLGRFAVSNDDKDRGAFKTPTLRNVTLSAPYMHDGSQQTLEEVIDWYNKGGHANEHLSEKMKKLNLTDQDKKDLVEFLNALTGDFPQVASGRLP